METWEGVINKLQERVKKWTYIALQLAERLILTKEVLQAISTYMMSVFPAPKRNTTKDKRLSKIFPMAR
jgi:hypothetical protein